MGVLPGSSRIGDCLCNGRGWRNSCCEFALRTWRLRRGDGPSLTREAKMRGAAGVCGWWGVGWWMDVDGKREGSGCIAAWFAMR